MTVFLHDEFTGSGSVSGRSPDTAGAGTWTSAPSTSVTGGVATAGAGLDYLNFTLPGLFSKGLQTLEAELVRVGTGTLDVYLGLRAGESFPGESHSFGLTVKSYGTPEVLGDSYAYFGGVGVRTDNITPRATPLDGVVFTLRVEFLGATQTAYVDGVPFYTVSGPGPAQFSTATAICKLAGASLRRVVWSGDIGVLPSSGFWTQLVGCEEV